MRSTKRLHYAWIVAAVTFVVGLLTAGVRAAPGVLIIPLEQEFDWSRATISLAVGINLLLYGLVGPFAAALMDRFGVRRTMTLGLAITAASVALSPAMHQAWQLVLLWGVVVGAGTGVIGAFISAYIAARWFRRRQGLVVGFADRRQRRRAACVPAQPCRARDPFRVAGDVAGSGRDGGGFCPAGGIVDAQPTERFGLDPLWRRGRTEHCDTSAGKPAHGLPLARSRTAPASATFGCLPGAILFAVPPPMG